MKSIFTRSYWAEFFFPNHVAELAALRSQIGSLQAQLIKLNPPVKAKSAWLQDPTVGIQPVSPHKPGEPNFFDSSRGASSGWFTDK